MNNLNTKLLSSYHSHYIRVNTEINPVIYYEKNKRDLDSFYRHILLNLPRDSKVLDLGCGTGIFLYYLSKYDNIIPVGVDISEEQISYAKKYITKAKLFCDDAINFTSNYTNEFTAIFMHDLLEHIETLEKCYILLQNCRKALRPKGFIFIRTPNGANITSCYSRYMDLTHRRIFTSKSLFQLLEICGFDNINVLRLKSGHLTGKIRLAIEHYFHKIIFLVCGRAEENCFASNLNVIAYKF